MEIPGYTASMVRSWLLLWISGASLILAAALDTRPHGLNVTLNGGADSTYSAWVSVSMSATDANGVTGYFLSESPSPPPSDAKGWTPVDPAPAGVWNAGFTLSPGHGVKTVYAWFRNAAGAVSGAVSTSILLAPAYMDNVHILSLRPDGRELYVASLESLAILVVDVTSATHPVVASIQTPFVKTSHPADVVYDIAFSPDGSRAYAPRLVASEYEACQNCAGLHGILVIDTATRRIASVLTVPEGGVPTGSAVVSRDGKYLFLTLTTTDGDFVGKYDLNAQKLAGRLALPGAGCVRLSPDGSRLHVSQGRRAGSTLAPNLFSVVDAARMELIGSVPAGDSPLESVATPDGRKAWVANFRSNDVTAIDLTAVRRIATIPAGSNPRSLALTPDGSKLYAGNTGLEGQGGPFSFARSLTVIDALRDVVVKTIPTGLEPQTLAMDPVRRLVYVSDGNANGLNPACAHVFDTATDSEIDQIVLRGSAYHAPTGLDVSPDGTTAYVIAEAPATLMAVRLPSGDVLATSHCYPRGVKLSRDGARVFVFSPQYPPGGDGRLFILDAPSLSLRETIDLGRISTANLGDQLAFRIVLDSREETAYLTLTEKDEVLVVDLRQKRLAARIALSPNVQPSNIPPNGLALSPDGSRLFATSCRGGSVTAIDTATNSVAGVVQLGECPAAVRITPDGRRAYVLQETSNTPIALVDVRSLTITRRWTTQSSVGAALDFVLSPDERYAYIACFDPNYLAIFDLGDVTPQDRKTRIIPTGIDPRHVVTGNDPTLIYGTVYTSDEIFVASMATNSIRYTVPLRLLAPAEFDLYAVVNAASFGSGAVAPGEIVTLFGKGLGPDGIVRSGVRPDGTLQNTLVGTKVLFNGTVMAPLIYVTPGQVAAIAPYQLGQVGTQAPYSLGKGAALQVVAATGSSNKLRLDVVPSAPAVFTADSSGAGQAAALNQDNRTNSASNPAAPGSIIQLFATGEGLTAPAGVDALIAGATWPKPLLPVKVSVGGAEAEITYYGAAPGAVAGLMQVNVRIPAGVSGAQSPLVLMVGGASSQPGVTIAVSP